MTKEQLARQLWLLHYNQVLRERGTIPEAHYLAMHSRILQSTRER